MTDLIQCGLGLSLALCGALILGLSLGFHCLERRGREVLHRLERLECGRRGFTLVELLVVIAITGILVALLLPAVQYARESARRATCQNHLRQIALAFHHHHDAVRHLPTGGWGWSYVGDPDAGMGAKQPGGWTYAALPFIEHAALRSIGTGQAGPLKRDELARLVRHPIGLFHCPSLRRPALYPITLQAKNAAHCERGAKIDYAACTGAGRDEVGEGHPHERPVDLGGIVGVKSTTRLAEITDGLSNTLMLSEKWLHPLHRDTGECMADNENLYCGLDNDSCRSTKYPPQTIGGREGFPYTFGSYHPSAFNAAMCDGRVESVSYAIDAAVFMAMGTRAGMEVNQ